MKKEFDKYIYLHFLDRELRGSLGLEGAKIDSESKIWIETALFMTDMPLYVSLSHMYESYSELPKTIDFLFELDKIDLVLMVSNHVNPDEFLESRKRLYSFDKKRYTRYFKKNSLMWPKNIHNDGKGTTEYLRNSILCNKTNLPEKFIYSVKNSIISNQNDAITIQRFVPIIKKSVPGNYFHHTKIATQTMISRFYTKRYLDACQGTLITGLPRLNAYDDLAENQVYTNYRIYSLLISMISGLWKKDDSFIAFLFSDEYNLLKSIIQSIVELADLLYDNGVSIDEIIAMIRKCDKVKMTNDSTSKLLVLQNYLCNICKERRIEMKKRPYTFLILVATLLELEVLLKELKKSYSVVTDIGEESHIMTNINGNLVYIVKSQMGAGGPGGSILTSNDAIKRFNPNAVIMYGIAWGSKKNNQQIGDILISSQVWEYDPIKINESNDISRGNIIPASPQLIQAFELVVTLEKQTNLYFGLVASGSKLLNNKSEVERLKDKKPELIGGEMEAAGVASSCERNNTQWIMIKGICDWGFDKESENKDNYQMVAAENAAQVLIKMLKLYNGK